MLCGDEIQAAIVDLGSSVCKFGTAGQDVPRHIFRSELGEIREDGSTRRLLIGDSALRNVADNVEIVKLRQASGDLDWEAVEAVLQYGLQSCLRFDPSLIPTMLGDSMFETRADKEKLMEICFESLSTPAFYLAPNAMLSAFSTGRPTSLVIDAGASRTSVVPVVDGFTLRKAASSTSRGGDAIDAILQARMEEDGVSHQPWFRVQSGGKAASIPVRSSFLAMHSRDVVADLKKWMCFIPYKPLDKSVSRADYVSSLQMPSYELPDGSSLAPQDKFCLVPDLLWFPAPAAGGGGAVSSGSVPKKRPRAQFLQDLPAHSQPLKNILPRFSDASQRSDVGDGWQDEVPLHELVYTSVARCEVDVRRELLANVVVVGGGSLIDGLSQRLLHELPELLPSNLKVKLTPTLPIERQNAAWIGGSILSICGSFQQLWVSSAEYAETGSAGIVEERFIH